MSRIPSLKTSVKIVSGGQTGADRAALDFAIKHGLPHGGWCPKDRRAEDGMIDRRYQLDETSTKNYSQRTEMNVKHSNGTVIFTLSPTLTGGSKKTAEFARKHGKPWIHLRPGKERVPATELLQFIRKNRIRTLNVAGSRASKEPQICGFVESVLGACFGAKQVLRSGKESR